MFEFPRVFKGFCRVSFAGFDISSSCWGLRVAREILLLRVYAYETRNVKPYTLSPKPKALTLNRKPDLMGV